MSINGFLLLKRTAVSPVDGALFFISKAPALLVPHKSTEEFSKTWNLSTAGLTSLERNVCRRWTMAFGANCSCFIRYWLVISQYLTNTSWLYLSHHITKLQEVLVRDFQRGKFYQTYCVQWAGLFLRHSECSSSKFFLAVLYSSNLKAEESRSVCCLLAFPHIHLFNQCSLTNYRFLRMQLSRYWKTLRYFFQSHSVVLTGLQKGRRQKEGFGSQV